MKKRRIFTGTAIAAMALLAAAVAAPARAGDVIDRIVATVNGHIILQSDWEDALRYEALSNGRPLEGTTAADRKAALDRLIDQELLREQMRSEDFHHVPEETVQRRLLEIRKQYAEAETQEGWDAVLGRYGLSEASVKQDVISTLDLARLVDSRLRPDVDIDSKSIESYYNQELLPPLRESGAKEPSLADVSPKIKELLTQQKVNELLTAWLQNLRSGSEIRTEDSSAGAMR